MSGKEDLGDLPLSSSDFHNSIIKCIYEIHCSLLYIAFWNISKSKKEFFFLIIIFAQDIKQICPTCIILLITIVIMVTVIPYAFSNVIKWVCRLGRIFYEQKYFDGKIFNYVSRQLQAADAVAAWREKMEENENIEA